MRWSAASRRFQPVTDIVAETARLRLRCWRPADREEFVRHLNTPAVMRWLGGVQDDAAYEAAFDRLEQYDRDFGHTLWIVERRSDGALLGFCGLKRINSPGAPNPGDFEIGWRLREDAWGQGFAKEAAIASLDLAFGRFGAPHVVALTVAGNSDSSGLMERLGMAYRPELDFEDHRFGPDLNPSIVYWLDAADWPAARAAALA
jgi:RimJ/RimL family protein N-acetyltransferase